MHNIYPCLPDKPYNTIISYDQLALLTTSTVHLNQIKKSYIFQFTQVPCIFFFRIKNVRFPAACTARSTQGNSCVLIRIGIDTGIHLFLQIGYIYYAKCYSGRLEWPLGKKRKGRERKKEKIASYPKRHQNRSFLGYKNGGYMIKMHNIYQ